MTDLLVKNAKIANSNDNKHTVYNFGIPAFQSESGLKTCPMAGQCAKGCYAQQGAYLWTPVAKAYEWRLSQTLETNFSDLMIKAIESKFKTANRQSKQLVIRIHDSGDFYNAEYIGKWFEVMKHYPTVKFYAYTKMVPLFQKLTKQGKVPANFTLIYSEGGLADAKINHSLERHSRVFESLEQLQAAGYIDTTENDLNAIGDSLKVGLCYHGHAKYKWNTAS
jgi:hypothetical protein